MSHFIALAQDEIQGVSHRLNLDEQEKQSFSYSASHGDKSFIGANVPDEILPELSGRILFN